MPAAASPPAPLYPDVGTRCVVMRLSFDSMGAPQPCCWSCPVLLTPGAAPWGSAQGNNPPTPITEGERGRTEEGSQSKQRQDGEPPRDRVIHSLILAPISDFQPRCASNL